MATVYKIEIQTTSAFLAHDKNYVGDIFADFIEKYKDKNTGLKFENTDISVEILNNDTLNSYPSKYDIHA